MAWEIIISIGCSIMFSAFGVAAIIWSIKGDKD